MKLTLDSIDPLFIPIGPAKARMEITTYKAPRVVELRPGFAIDARGLLSYAPSQEVQDAANAQRNSAVLLKPGMVCLMTVEGTIVKCQITSKKFVPGFFCEITFLEAFQRLPIGSTSYVHTRYLTPFVEKSEFQKGTVCSYVYNGDSWKCALEEDIRKDDIYCFVKFLEPHEQIPAGGCTYVTVENLVLFKEKEEDRSWMQPGVVCWFERSGLKTKCKLVFKLNPGLYWTFEFLGPWKGATVGKQYTDKVECFKKIEEEKPVFALGDLVKVKRDARHPVTGESLTDSFTASNIV